MAGAHPNLTPRLKKEQNYTSAPFWVSVAWYAVNFVRMMTDEVCLANLTVLFFCQRANVT